MTLEKLYDPTQADYDPTRLQGYVSSWKGKYFEVELRDRLNNGEWVGDLHLNSGQYATLASDLSQPGWDLAILNDDGTVDTILQAKATESLSLIREALERYPDIEIVATHEVAEDLTDQVINSEISNEGLERDILAPMKDLLAEPIKSVLEWFSPLVPVLIIGFSEGRKAMIGQQTLQEALNNSLGQGRCITETNSAIANTIGERVAQSILDRADQLRKRSLAEYMLDPHDEIY